MTFRINPKPAIGTGARQQAIMLKQMLESGGWPAALDSVGPTPEHVPLMSAMWVIAWSLQGATTTLSWDGHEITWSYPRNRGMKVEVDGWDVPWHHKSLRIMLLEGEEVTS